MPGKVQRVEWRCRRCNDVRWLLPSIASHQQFCSRECQRAARRKPLAERRARWGDRRCQGPDCEVVFVPGAERNVYCSRRCVNRASQLRRARAGGRQPRTCEGCQNVFEPASVTTAGRFCSRACFYKVNRGANHGSWRGGRYVNRDGYIQVQAPDHPRRDHGKYVLEHILVMERRLGRYLRDGEEAHHKNGIRDDNRDDNLELWTRNHPPGQRVADLLEWARNFLDRYTEEEALIQGGALELMEVG